MAKPASKIYRENFVNFVGYFVHFLSVMGFGILFFVYLKV